MIDLDFYEDLKRRFEMIVKKYGIPEEKTVTVISSRTLSPKEAIGEPERKDFPLIKGKEVMIEADFQNFKGQAYTDMPGSWQGSIKELFLLSLSNNFQRAVFVASMNAIMRYLNLITGTVHCKDNEPEICASQLSEYIQKLYGKPKIAFVGFQPAMIDKLSKNFAIRVLDLDEDNIGKLKYGVLIEGEEKTEEVLHWGDVIIATGSTVVNKTITRFLREKPVIFYGVTIAGIAYIYGLNRFCPCGH